MFPFFSVRIEAFVVEKRTDSLIKKNGGVCVRKTHRFSTGNGAFLTEKRVEYS